MEEILSQLVNGVDGCLVAAVAGMDGLVIEQSPRESHEVPGVVAELTNALTTLAGTMGDQLGAGALHEVIVTSERRTLYARLLDAELFALLVLNRHGNVGKARLLTSEAARKILGAFA